MIFKIISTLTISFAVVAIFRANPVSGIKCFQCNSINNSACTNLELYTKGFLYPTECGDEYQPDPFCRKTVIKVMDKHKNVEPRVIRSCGWVKYKKPCYTADNEGHMEIVCQCFEDGCNSASSERPAIFIISGIAALILWKIFDV